MPARDDDAVQACADLAARSGARGLEVGYLHDDVPAEQAGWYASATYHGARITADNHPGPVEACDALARRLLDGAQCQRCHRTVTLTGDSTASVCRWARYGPRWNAGCQPPPDLPPATRPGEQSQPPGEDHPT